jgi:hypothetical protein
MSQFFRFVDMMRPTGPSRQHVMTIVSPEKRFENTKGCQPRQRSAGHSVASEAVSLASAAQSRRFQVRDA